MRAIFRVTRHPPELVVAELGGSRVMEVGLSSIGTSIERSEF
jgi:hypothetical protein